jgi:hypothetical protein
VYEVLVRWICAYTFEELTEGWFPVRNLITNACMFTVQVVATHLVASHHLEMRPCKSRLVLLAQTYDGVDHISKKRLGRGVVRHTVEREFPVDKARQVVTGSTVRVKV